MSNSGSAAWRHGTWRHGTGAMAALALAVAALLALARPAAAQTEIDITEGRVAATPIAVATFTGPSTEEAELARAVAEVVRADLDSSDLFVSIDESRFLETITNPDRLPRFSDWRILNAQALLTGRVLALDEDSIRVEFRLWDVFAAEQLFGLQLSTERRYWRRLAHIVADKVFERLTGELGYFDSKIVYVAESGSKGQRRKQLILMDQDGANARPLSDDRNIVLTPRFSPIGEEIVYLSYESGLPKIYTLNLESGRKGVIGAFPNITFAPRFSPDGYSIIMSLADGGNSHIHVVDLRTRESRQLTDSLAIDTAPSYSPDGRRIAFESDRGGSQQLYVMNADGSRQRRISFGQGRYATPVWSPRGDWIAFVKQFRGEFYLGVMTPEGTNERILARSYHNEGPTWAPNGRILMFFRETAGEGGGPGLWRVSVNGGKAKPVKTRGFASDPAWSPLLHRLQAR